VTAERALASRTAQYVALYRALETAVSERAPLFSDPFAVRFLGRSYQRAVTLSRLRPLRVVLEAYADYRAPGARTSAIARTRLIDDVVRQDARAGTKQLVILGAGYDCRAHRLEELRACRVFEVDRAATQDEKRRHLGANGRTDVVYVPIDFGVDDLGASLDRAAFDRSLRTTFVWEGVTNYLDEASVGKVLRFVGTMPSGSHLVFTYVHRGVIDGSVDFPGGAKIRQNTRRLGEPWTFGLHPEETASFLSRFGLALERDVGADAYRAQFALPTSGYAFYRVAVGRVDFLGTEASR
jgi:methyltransferase (TIGR00027 family)